jgi:hypothetical protein
MLIAVQYNRKNNGDISVPRKNLEALGFGVNGNAFASGVKELVDKGFVIITRPGAYRVGCSLYAVTFEPINASDKHDYPEERVASNLWEQKRHCTDSVHSQERKPCLASKTEPQHCTETVPVEAPSAPNPSTETVRLLRSTKRSVLCAVASASADASAFVSEVSSKGLDANAPNAQTAKRFGAIAR